MLASPSLFSLVADLTVENVDDETIGLRGNWYRSHPPSKYFLGGSDSPLVLWQNLSPLRAFRDACLTERGFLVDMAFVNENNFIGMIYCAYHCVVNEIPRQPPLSMP